MAEILSHHYPVGYRSGNPSEYHTGQEALTNGKFRYWNQPKAWDKLP
jgi:hypothetical protein